MTAYRNNAADWLDTSGAPVWTKRIGDRVGTVFEAVDTGLRASQDYRRLAARHAPEEAGRIVFQKHFSNNSGNHAE